MLPVKFENHVMPPKIPSPPSALAKIPFSYFIEPFTNLLSSVGRTMLLPALIALDYSFKVYYTASVVFSRLFYSPYFNPLDPSFEKVTLANFEKRYDSLKDQLDLLDQKFKQEHLIARDMKDLHRVTYEINQINRQLKHYLAILNNHAVHLDVQDDIEHVQGLYQQLIDQIDDYFQREGDNLLNQFHKVLDLFTRGGIDLPDNIRRDLIQTWKGLEASMKGHVNHLQPPKLVNNLKGKLAELKDRMEAFDGNSTQESRVGLAQPLKLRNIGNSCYLDSVFQALACVDSICEDFNAPIPHGQDSQKKIAIQQELLQFLNVQKMNQGGDYSQMEFILFLLGGPSLHRLRGEIFKSGLHPSLDMHELTRQHDAHDVAMLLIQNFLPSCQFKLQQRASVEQFPGIEFHYKTEDYSTLQIPLRPKVSKMTDLLKWVLHKHHETENKAPFKEYDPKNGVIIDEAEAAAVLEEAPQKLPKSVKWARFKELPNVMTLQLLRFNQRQGKPGAAPVMHKDSSPVHLPENGIIDLTHYYDAPKDAPANAKYKIKSFVVHSGSYSGGHYVAYVEMNGKYYLCDDLDSKCYKQITKKEFLSKKDAYLVVLERLPEESQAKA